MKSYYIVASRGRNPTKPTSRESGLPTVQRLELNKWGGTNTITSVAKDNYVLEIWDEELSDSRDTCKGEEI